MPFFHASTGGKACKKVSLVPTRHACAAVAFAIPWTVLEPMGIQIIAIVSSKDPKNPTIQIVGMGVESPRLLQGGVESELPVFGEARTSKVEACRDHLDIAIPEGVIHHILIFFHLKTAF